MSYEAQIGSAVKEFSVVNICPPWGPGPVKHCQALSSCQDLLNLLDYSLVIASWLDVATSASTYRERVQLASTIRVFRFVRIVRVLENSKSDLLVIARGPNVGVWFHTTDQ